MSSKIRIATAATLALLTAGCKSYPAAQFCADARFVDAICRINKLAPEAVPPTPPGVVAENVRDLTCAAAEVAVARCDAAGKRLPEQMAAVATCEEAHGPLAPQE